MNAHDETGSGALVVLVGPDNVGKSSVLRELRWLRPDWPSGSIDPADLFPLPGLDYLNFALETHPRVFCEPMGPLGRTSWFVHSLSLLYEYRLLPELDRGRLVLADSLHYRIQAKEELLGSPGAAVMETLGRQLRRPDLVVWLDVPLEVSWRRGGESCKYYEALGELTWEGYRRMQEGVRDLILNRYVDGIPTRLVDGTAPVGVVAGQIVRVVEEVMGTMSAPAKQLTGGVGR
jgi:thymidylate kinase